MKEHNASGPGPGWHPNASVPVPAMSTERLLPALLECFGIILCGYVTGRAKVITSSQAKALGSFVSLFALPALLYKNMVLLDFSHVIWPFLWSILVAKVSVFAVVCVLTMLVASPESRLSKAGLFSIFATQSNDFALGYPIVEALYQSSHPEYLQYIYLVAPISLVLLNPLGFTLCEVQRWRSGQDRRQGGLRTAGTVVLRVLRNPVVFMVAVGLASRFTLGRRVPDFLSEFVDALASAFGGTALFYLGLCMVGQLRKLTGSTATALILLITAKLLVMPLICRDMVELLDMGNTSSINHSSLSNYAFLYGTFPTAPSVAIYAAHYSMELEVVTSGMVISTFLSAPIMYVSAWLMTIPWMDTKPLATALQNISFNISIVSLVALVWTMAVTLLSKKFKKLPHMFTLNLFTAQFLACIGMILWNFIVKEDNFVGQVLTFILLYGSLYSAYVWTGLVAFSLALMSKDDELKVPPGIFFLIGWGVPALIVGTLLIAGDKMTNTIDSAFFYGNPQVISTAVVLACSILLGGASLMALSRGFRTLHYQVLEPEDQQPHNGPEILTSCEPAPEENLFDRDCHLCDCAQPRPQTIPGTSMNDTSSLPAGQCQEPCESSYCLLAQEDRRQLESDQQVAQHVLLCLLLIVILLANVSSCLWWLFNNVPGRLYLELQFFCAIANYGQGFISFGIFGLDKHLIILPLKKRLMALWQSRKQAEQEEVPSSVPEEVRLTCTQFVRYHKDQCVQDIVQMRRCGVRSVKATFLGSELVDWLLRVGLAHDRGEATLYGASLLQGAVLQHVTQEFDFQDDDLHYLFTTEGGDAER